jgi:hypothetical protein
MHIAGAVVAEKVIELVESPGNIRVPTLVDNVQMFAGVGVVKAQPVFGLRCRRNVGSVNERREKPQNDEPKNGPQEHRLDPCP